MKYPKEKIQSVAVKGTFFFFNARRHKAQRHDAQRHRGYLPQCTIKQGAFPQARSLRKTAQLQLVLLGSSHPNTSTWIGLGWIGFDCIRLNLVWTELTWIGLNWNGWLFMYCSMFVRVCFPYPLLSCPLLSLPLHFFCRSPTIARHPLVARDSNPKLSPKALLQSLQPKQ